MDRYDSFYTWLTETQADNETTIGMFDLTIGKIASKVGRDRRFPRNSHRKQYHISYMLRNWPDLGFEGVGFSGVMDILWPMYLRAVTPCINCPDRPEYLAFMGPHGERWKANRKKPYKQ